MSDDGAGGLLARLRRRIEYGGIRGHLLGLLVRPYFQKAGIIVVSGGWSLPTIENHGGRIEIGNCALFSGVRLEVWKDATLRIGTGTYLNRNTEITVARSVTIGDHCRIARDVLIMDSDQHAHGKGELVVEPVVIEEWVWIGARAIILKGVTIGEGSIIGAGAIVTKSVPPKSVVVGPAASVIRIMPRDD